MFVSETSLFSADTIRLRILSVEGALWYTDISPTISIEELTTLAVGHFYDQTDKTKFPAKYRLIHVPSKRCLEDEKTVTDEELRTNGE